MFILLWLYIFGISYSLFAIPIASIFILLVAFEIKSVNDLFKRLIIFYSLVFFIAGIFLYFKSEFVKSFFASIVALALIIFIMKYYNKNRFIKNFSGELIINILNQELKVRAFIDTGNNLSSYYSDEVIIISKKVVNLIDDDEARKILKGSASLNLKSNFLKIKLVTFSSLGNKFDYKFGIESKDTKFIYDGNTYSKNSILISSDEDFSNYDAIVSLKFIDEKNKEENSNGDIVDYERKSKEVV